MHKKFGILFAAFTVFSINPGFAGEVSLKDLDLPYVTEPEEGLVVGGQPSKEDLERLAADGVKVIVNLRTPGEFDKFDEGDVVRALGMTYVNIPVYSMKDLTRENATLLHDALEAAGGAALVHCTIGMRAGSLMAVEKYLFHGYDETAALDYAEKAHMGHMEKAIEDALKQINKNE